MFLKWNDKRDVLILTCHNRKMQMSTIKLETKNCHLQKQKRINVANQLTIYNAPTRKCSIWY